MKKWIIGILAALVVGGGGFGLYQVFNDGYTEQPGVVYNNDGDGHDHDHGYFGVE
jgi:hypothetical protein